MTLIVRPADRQDEDAIWHILMPTIRAGETYPLPRDMSRADALVYWHRAANQVFVAEQDSAILGTYFVRPNNLGAGAHIANCGFVVGEAARGKGVARQMCAHALEHAKSQSFTAMQFNFVVATNEGAIALWTSMGFTTLCRLPGVFDHPREGLVDALLMFKELTK